MAAAEKISLAVKVLMWYVFSNLNDLTKTVDGGLVRLAGHLKTGAFPN